MIPGSHDEDKMTRKPLEEKLLTVSIHREYWTAVSQKEGRPVRSVPVLDCEKIQAADLLFYQQLGGFNTATPAVPHSTSEVRFTNGRNPTTDPAYDGQVEFAWMQIHGIEGRTPQANDIYAIGDMLRIPCCAPRELAERRERIANQAFEDAGFGDLFVEAHNGWDVSGDRHEKLVFLDVGGEASAKMTFAVEFVPGTAAFALSPEFDLPARIEDPEDVAGYVL